MTNLELLIRRSVESSAVTTISRTAERAAESLVEEMLKDPAFRARFRTLVEHAFERTLVDLDQDTEEPS